MIIFNVYNVIVIFIILQCINIYLFGKNLYFRKVLRFILNPTANVTLIITQLFYYDRGSLQKVGVGHLILGIFGSV